MGSASDIPLFLSRIRNGEQSRSRGSRTRCEPRPTQARFHSRGSVPREWHERTVGGLASTLSRASPAPELASFP